MIEALLEKMKAQLKELADTDHQDELKEAADVAHQYRILLDYMYERSFMTIDQLDEFEAIVRELGLAEGDDDPAE